MKRKFFIFLVIFVSVLSTGFAQDDDISLKRVVIDAGHGGKDPGAVSKNGLYEKDVVLDVSLQLGELIRKNYPDVEVIYTRDSDEFIELHKRAKIANEANADLFISIHANAAGATNAYGTESWVLGLHKSEAALEVAKRENASILLEEDHESKYESFDPNDPDAYIIFALRQSAFLAQSIDFAQQTQTEFKSVSRHDRGVRQAGFLVLYRTTMPSVLIELGFLTNPKEESYLKSKNGRAELAESIYDAFSAYKNKVDGINDAVKGDNNDESTTVTTTYIEKGVTFKVQIATSTRQVELKPENFKGVSNVDEYISGGMYKYTVGAFGTFDDANSEKNALREKGFDTAFVVAFHDGERIPLAEARELVKNE